MNLDDLSALVIFTVGLGIPLFLVWLLLTGRRDEATPTRADAPDYRD